MYIVSAASAGRKAYRNVLMTRSIREAMAYGRRHRVWIDSDNKRYTLNGRKLLKEVWIDD